MRLPRDFKEFLRLLAAHRVEYLLIGGYAVGYHGYPRATADMDIFIARHPQNAGKVAAAVREFGFDVPGLTEDLFLEPERVVRMGLPPVRIEILTTISGVSFEECYPHRISASIDGVDVHLIDLAHLRINKLASGRHKDLNDLENLP